MTQTGARSLLGAEQALSPLQRPDLPSFLVALPGGRVIEATAACAALGIRAGAPAPARIAEDARRLRALSCARFGYARLRLPGLLTPRLFRYAPLALPGGLAVLFADPAAFATDAGTAPTAPPVPLALRPLLAQPARITFETDAAGRILTLSPLFADALGARAARMLGRSFAELAADGLMSGGEALDAALAGGSFSEMKARIAASRPDEAALDLSLGGVPVFDGARHRQGTRGFGILSAAVADAPAPIARPEPAPPPRPAPRATAGLGENVVPLRAGTLSPQERSAFREIARTLAAAIEDWPKGIPPEPEPDAEEPDEGGPDAGEPDETLAAAPPLPDAARPDTGPAEAGEAPEAGRDFELLDRLPLGLLVLQDGHASFINRTLLDWTGRADLAEAEAAGGLDAMLVREGADLLLASADGARRPVEVRLVAAPFLGRPALLHVIRPQAEAQTRQDRAAARREAIDMVPWPVFLVEREGAIRLANAAAAERVGFAAADLAGEPFTTAIAPEYRAAAVAALDAACADEPPRELRLALRHRDGGLCPGRAGVMRAGAEGQLLCVVVGPDVAPESAADRLPFLARRLNAALAGPLARLAADDCPVPEAQAARAAVAATLDDLSGLAEDAPPAPAAPCDLAAVVTAAADGLALAARRRRVALRRDTPAALSVRADAPRLARLVRLLLEEALDATPAGGSIAVSLASDGNGACLKVSDGGAALDEVTLAAALDPAAQMPEPGRFDTAGRPLRLARLAREATLLGGTLTARPDSARGMTVLLHLPA